MFDKMLLDDLDNVVGAAAHSREAIQHDGGLFEVEVPPEAVVNKLVLNQLPKFVILQVHAGSTLNCSEERSWGLSVKTLNLVFDHGEDNVPEVVSFLEFVHANEVEAKHNLLVSHVLAVLLVHEDDVVGVLGG